MSFSQMVKILKEENKGKIVFVNAGAFYIAIEEDAVLLNNKLKLKCSCFQKNTCKVDKGTDLLSLGFAGLKILFKSNKLSMLVKYNIESFIYLLYF